MKKIMNGPADAVTEMLEGLVRSRPSLRKLDGMNCVVRTSPKNQPSKVAIVSLGGSGHEPAHAGYVGFHGLDGAACGAIFSSPSVDQIVETAKAVSAGQGVLFVVKNYTGDRLNTEMARELLAAEAIQSDQVIVSDDVAVEDSTYTSGRRGIIGTIFVHHLAGVLSARGVPLVALKTRLESAINRIRSAGVSLSGCTIPAVGKPGFEIAADEMEWFMGIHGEPGIKRAKIAPSRDIANGILDRIHADLPFESGMRYAVIVNGCGGTPLMELYILMNDVGRYLEEKGVVLAKAFVGNFMTSLEMQGASLSTFKINDPQEEEILKTPSCIFPAENNFLISRPTEG